MIKVIQIVTLQVAALPNQVIKYEPLFTIIKKNKGNFLFKESRTRVGDEFQALTNYIESSNEATANFKETLIWTPSNKLNDTESKIKNYCIN